jgi:hypothetical protein
MKTKTIQNCGSGIQHVMKYGMRDIDRDIYDADKAVTEELINIRSCFLGGKGIGFRVQE